MQKTAMEIRPLNADGYEDACALVRRVFAEHVAPLFPPEGVEEFLSYVTPEALTTRREEGNLQLAAWQGGDMIAFLEMRTGPHLALLFVDSARQRGGVGRGLLARGLELWPEAGFSQVTVNASPNAVGAYARLGFAPDGGLQTHNGITFQAMRLEIEPNKGNT
ncbi:MAG: GNAT family N-acetyltransferase [Desulfarculaceae bacterium]|nr:GNAT family N-acetyltransferase [Desulfarculaceae bacterium]